MRGKGESEPKVKVAAKEDDKAYTNHADVPGAKTQDLKVTIDGSLCRSFSFDSAVYEAGGSATNKDDVLEIVLPKKSRGGQTKSQVT